MHGDILFDIALCIVTATAFAFVAKWLRQPLILAYVLAGVAIGSTQGFGWIGDPQELETISELGLILLLFMIGLEIDLKKLKAAGKTVLAAGTLQFVVCTGLGLLVMPLIVRQLGDGRLAVVYLAVATALSSTMIVVKLLYDKFELDTLPGRITLGILVFQDIWAILFLALQPNLRNPVPSVLLVSLVKGVTLVACALLASRFLLPPLFRSIAKLPELMLIGGLAWCFGITMLAAALGLSREMGALIAGVAISTFPYNLDVIAKVITLRDFFITLFFVTLGAKIPQPTWQVFFSALGASLFVVASRFVSISPIVSFLGNGARASFVSAWNLAQISEFSLVIASLGVALGHISQATLSVIVFTLVITSVTSTYGILYSHQVFQYFYRRLARRADDEAWEESERRHFPARPIMILGFFRTASSLLHDLIAEDPPMREQVGVIDFNPDVKRELDRLGIQAVYGDVSHVDTLHHAGVHHARVLLSTVPDHLLKGTTNARLLRQLKSMAPNARVIVTADLLDAARALYREGADFVYIPRLMSVEKLREVVLAALEDRLQEKRLAACAALDGRVEVLP